MCECKQQRPHGQRGLSEKSKRPFRLVQRFFFFQAEDGIRDYKVTGVQTCALPILLTIPITVGFGAMENAGLITYSETSILRDAKASKQRQLGWISVASHELAHQWFEIGRASCRERV